MSPTSWCNFHRHVHSQSQAWCTANWQPVEDEIQISDLPPLWESGFQEYLLFTRQVSLMLELQIMDTNESHPEPILLLPIWYGTNTVLPIPIRSDTQLHCSLNEIPSSYGSRMNSVTETPTSEPFLDTFLMQNQDYKTNQGAIRRLKGP